MEFNIGDEVKLPNDDAIYTILNVYESDNCYDVISSNERNVMFESLYTNILYKDNIINGHICLSLIYRVLDIMFC